MKALISPGEMFNLTWISSWVKDDKDQWQPVYSEILDCQRVAEVELTPFEVAQPLHWVDCPDDCVADQWYYKDDACYIKPTNVSRPE